MRKTRIDDIIIKEESVRKLKLKSFNFDRSFDILEIGCKVNYDASFG